MVCAWEIDLPCGVMMVGEMGKRKTAESMEQDRIDTASGAVKRCYKCGEQVPLTGFYFDGRSVDRRAGCCRRCIYLRRHAHLVELARRYDGGLCPLCCGLAHRVEGVVCAVCGLVFAPLVRGKVTG